MHISKYKLKSDVIILNKLFLKDDEVYIEEPNLSEGFKGQRVFMTDRTLIGTINGDFYYELNKQMVKIKNI